ncbi:aspartate-alanine antiporter-like transporter [Gulosibacter chungangensis]|uniref:YidE/YbjL duplication domain-containing protein n=1 Tax=Gulosibacter chungangensis TaxID=979746 RepID=A0A7J5BCC3_9MICO|nr:hypothetical protein [Gulosibacter chungangensis]KAB1643471.1 hypothetical protein F8O05_06175 [Gulosibacter chungangensis]
MVELLVASPLLTLFLTAALGTLVGAIPFGPLKFGAAGALFVGLALGALDPNLGTGLEIVQSIGLALFVYTVGLASGASFFEDLRRQAPLMVGALILLVVFSALAILANRIFNIGAELTAGLMASALTSTPALAAATTAAGGSPEPAVGYSIAHPVGVVIAMIIVTFVARGTLPAKKDPNPRALPGLRPAQWRSSIQCGSTKFPESPKSPGATRARCACPTSSAAATFQRLRPRNSCEQATVSSSWALPKRFFEPNGRWASM